MEVCMDNFPDLLKNSQRSINYFKSHYRIPSDEVESHCHYGLLKAVNTYNHKDSFERYAFNLMRRELYNHVVVPNKPHYVKLTDNLGYRYDFDSHISYKQYLRLLCRKLTKKQRQILLAMILHKDIHEMKEMINISRQAIYQIQNVIRKKMLSVLREEQFQIKLIEKGVI